MVRSHYGDFKILLCPILQGSWAHLIDPFLEIDGPVGYQGELGIISDNLLHGPVKALATVWKRKVAGALEKNHAHVISFG